MTKRKLQMLLITALLLGACSAAGPRAIQLADPPASQQDRIGGNGGGGGGGM
jgi:hypothetical protein